MNSERTAKSVLVLHGIVAFVICASLLHGQQSASSTQFGQRPPSAGSTGSAASPIGGAGSGGGSSWGAGKGSFGTGVQHGGMWHDDGPSLGSAAGSGTSTQARPSAASGLPSGGGLPSGFSPSTPSSSHGSAESGAVRSFHSPSVRASGYSVIHHGVASPSRGRSHATAGSEWRVASHGRASTRDGARQSSGVTTSMPKQSVKGNSHLDLGLDTGLPANGVGHQTP
jgi:hypothetical protein